MAKQIDHEGNVFDKLGNCTSRIEKLDLFGHGNIGAEAEGGVVTCVKYTLVEMNINISTPSH